jgi:hypothetical protein
MPRRSAIQEIVQQFVSKLSSLIEQDSVARARDLVLGAFGRGRGGGGGAEGIVVGRRRRRKGPIQLCPVPGCGSRAAPVFGMVCSKHKDLPKADIKKYREQRRAKKAKSKKRK